MTSLKGAAILSFLSSLTMTKALPAAGTVTEISSFSIPQSPSGMYFDEGESGLLYILCGTRTNGDHSLYAYTTDGDQRCFITIPQSVGMSRVDGFYITHGDGKAYIVDSQGPIYAPQGDNYLGGSVYEVEWTNPCGCSSDGTCTESSVTWNPTVTKSWSLSAADVSSSEGGGNDEYFRNSGIVVSGDTWFGVNGVHPIGGSLTGSYPKSIVQVDKATSSVLNTWAFDGSTIGHDVDMEGLTCGPDQCSSTLYIGDEYNYIYELDLETGVVGTEWDLNSIVGNVPTDKGIESLTYASTTGYFYAGIQQTANIHVVRLDSVAAPAAADAETSSTESATSTTESALGQCAATEEFPKCSAPAQDVSSQRVRREIRSLSTEEWDKVVAAMWVMKNEESMETGKVKYGDSFRTYDYFVVKHAVASTDTRGDQAHFGAHFITWHAAFVLEFENALLAIDPSIGAMPYWDETIAAPSVFTEDYFGVDPSSTDSTTFEVTTGKFANWPISHTFSIDDWTPYMADTSTVTYNGNMASPSILRGGENNVVTTYVTRFGRGSDWESSPPSAEVWWGCTGQDVAEWNDWYKCIEQGGPSLHSGPHRAVGGSRRDEEGIRGDFEDPVTSPNGALFMFHHANLDRNRMWWMARNEDKEELVCQYYGFPAEGGAYIHPAGMSGNGDFAGAHLNDVVSSSWGFTAADLGFAMEDEGDAAVAIGRSGSESGALLTHADLVCWMAPETALYTYDTNAACLQDSTQCNSFQGVVENTSDATTAQASELESTATTELNEEHTSSSPASVAVGFAIASFVISTLSFMS